MDRVHEKNEEASHEASCSDCGLLNCYRQESRFPDFCPGEGVEDQVLEAITSSYCAEDEDSRAAKAAAEVEGLYYGKLTRVEEVLAFARRIGARKIGLATCVGLVDETRLFSKMLRQNGFEPYTVLCKIGSVDKTEIGIHEELKLRPESFEALCNPLLQAKMLNDWKSDLNVVIGLCVGHDALFCRHSEALVTTLIVKDRVLAHNPAAALYTSRSYYKRVMETGLIL
ncbi:MAG: DUF1847 domain-containing protein [Chlorobium sp.]|uniref:DUF1847 domain-containing protein n=1 Tax=Chlorobium sp. TaxID=1095 RepID=UPI0025BC4C47|nr:DUF1847 domain-containing protein [Chlorobium sp.]MCF8217270.1 DUF1847 domain-containing protein [Chlorobium sp.]MCF8272115.1 DUF1847 domain-containing protein [Chlorobium sp.]MCF8288485.1 DUF1847 domain-containing protein [Chlorobium sp.]MCF8292080.1 DUF1847 domain-containing protein [Chlorobium sp.]MCF8386181.1 DUF1847 domain-containing protein [Chlorobium sp.]